MKKFTIALLIPLALACGSDAPEAVMVETVEEESTEVQVETVPEATPSQTRVLLEATKMEEGMETWFGEVLTEMAETCSEGWLWEDEEGNTHFTCTSDGDALKKK